MIKKILYILMIIVLLPTMIARCQKQMSVIYLKADSLFKAGSNLEASKLYRQLLNEPINDSIKAEVFIHLGYMQGDFNKYDSGIYLLKQAALIWLSHGNLAKVGRTYDNIGNMYAFKKNYREARVYFQDGLRLAKLTKDSVKIYISIFLLYGKQKFHDSAYRIIKDHLLKYPENLVRYQTYYISQGQGIYYQSVKKYDSALIFLRVAAISAPDNVYKSLVLNDIAETYKEMGNYSLAFVYQDSSSYINSTNSLTENLQAEFDTYSSLHEKTGNFKKALYYAKMGRALSDSFFDAEKNTAMIDAEAKYQNQLALAENANLEKDKTITQRNFVFSVIALGLVALLAFLAFRNTRIKQKANTLLTQQKQQVQQLADQLSVANDTKARLFSTIGHDLRSPVSSLYASLKMQELKGNSAGGEMSEQTVRLLDTLEELLIWSKSQMDGFKVQPVKVNVRYFFEDLKDFYSNAADAKNISIVNDTAKDVVVRTDENLLKTIYRNAISNAIVNTAPNSTIRLTTLPAKDSKICIAVLNPCQKESFQIFKTNFDEAAIKSGAYGLGIVLMKEFAQKLGAEIDLAYTNGCANLSLCV